MCKYSSTSNAGKELVTIIYNHVGLLRTILFKIPRNCLIISAFRAVKKISRARVSCKSTI